MSINHEARAREAWVHLVKLAKTNEVMNYAQIAGHLGLHHRSAAWFLGVIQQHCKAYKLPPLQALVVNKQTQLPGHGYSGSTIDTKSHNKVLKQVRNYQWPDKAPF